MSNRLLTAAIATAFVAPAAMAQIDDPIHNYVELDYRTLDWNEDGIGLRASIVLMPQIHLFGNAHRVTDGPLRRDQGTLALGWHMGIMPATDVILRGGWTRARDRIGEDNGFLEDFFDFIDNGEVTTARDDGFVAQAGLRHLLLDELELHGYVQHEDIYGGNTGVGVGAIYNFTPNIGISALAEVAEEDTTYELGFRFTFGNGAFGLPGR